MEFDPPIASQNTDDLIAILHFSENCSPSDIIQIQLELTKRGVSVEQQHEKLAEWEKQSREEYKSEMRERAIKSFGTFRLLWMALKLPRTIFEDWSLKKDGYIKMHKERLYSIGIGILFWILMFLLLNIELERSQQEWQSKVNKQDIYAWEKEHYTDEEIAESRRKSIEKVIRTVQRNESTTTLTYVIIDLDTILNSQIEQLRNLDLYNIRSIVFDEEFGSEPHQHITIKLLKPVE